MRNVLFIFYLCLLSTVALGLGDSAEPDEIEQFGITWAFDKNLSEDGVGDTYQVGQFVNGDWWVVGSCNVSTIDPAWDGESHGSMVNPVPDLVDNQAYDSRVVGYNATLRVDAPVTLDPNDSLISTISWVDADSEDPDYPSNNIPRPALKTAAVLTVLLVAPDDLGATVFRPPYAGNNKPLYSTSDLRKDLLPNLALVANTPDIEDITQNFERVWLDHFSSHGDAIQYTSPTLNQPTSGWELALQFGEASLLLMLDEDSLIVQQGTNKDLVLIPVVQYGIDLYEVVENGGYWWDGGGLRGGRKWPIIFAGVMLDHSGMTNIGTISSEMPHLGFQEDGQTFYVSQTDVDQERRAPSGDYTWDAYLEEHIGLPEWGQQHCHWPASDGSNWDTKYRDSNGRGFTGFVLAARIMGQKEVWNHDTLFDYIDRWVDLHNEYYSGPEANRGYYVYGGDFQEDMWTDYRADYGSVWPEVDEVVPTITSPTVTSVTTTTATLGANVINTGGLSLIVNGTVWGTSVNPIGNSVDEGGHTTGIFTHSRTGLTAGTQIYYRGYAINSEGTAYSADDSFYTEPTTQPTNISFSSVTNNGMTISWTNGNGDGRIVIVKSGGAVDSHPVDGTEHLASAEFGIGAQLGTGNYVVYRSTGSSVAITGLGHSTTYHVTVYEYTGVGSGSSGINYQQDAPLTSNQATTTPPSGKYYIGVSS